jgi:hypothetical protein
MVGVPSFAFLRDELKEARDHTSSASIARSVKPACELRVDAR